MTNYYLYVKITYDNHGNRISDGTRQFTWTRGRLLSSVGGANYTYDCNGMRVSKTYNGVTTTYHYDGDRLIAEFRSDGKKLYYFYDDSGICGIYYNGTTYEVVRNIFGDVLYIYNGNTCVARYRYDAFGNCTVVQADHEVATLNPFRYRGYYYDTESNLYYLQTRYYDPEVGQFISPDSPDYLNPIILGGVDLYAYCLYNPISYKQLPISFGDSSINSSGSNRVNWGNGGFQIPIWISTLMSSSDFGASIAPALRTIYQYVRYPGVKDLNKLYGLDFVPGKLNTVCSIIGYGLLGTNIVLSAISNFTNDDLTTKQQWISFGVDTAYTLANYGIGYIVGTAVSLIPGIGVFLAPFAAAGVTWLIDWTNELWGWVDDIKQWLNDL